MAWEVPKNLNTYLGWGEVANSDRDVKKKSPTLPQPQVLTSLERGKKAKQLQKHLPGTSSSSSVLCSEQFV